jgi:ABC-type transporter Mla MlaB component
MVAPMLKAEIHQSANDTKLVLEGRLVGLWADHVMSMVHPRSSSSRLIVDLTEVTYVDASGEAVLEWLATIGAEFAAENCYSLDICERLFLPLVQRSQSIQ